MEVAYDKKKSLAASSAQKKIKDKKISFRNKQKAKHEEIKECAESIANERNVERVKVKNGAEILKSINNLDHRIKKLRIIFEEILWELIKLYLMIKGLITILKNFM